MHGTDIGARNGSQKSNHSKDRKFHRGTRAETTTTEVKVAEDKERKRRYKARLWKTKGYERLSLSVEEFQKPPIPKGQTRFGIIKA